MLLFEIFLWAHIATGATGLVVFWIPVLSRKGAPVHRRWGRIFSWCMIATGCSASGMALCTLAWPLETHPKLTDVAMILAYFGWMMIYLAVMTIALAWHGLETIRNKAQHEANRHPLALLLEAATIILALNCFWQGFLLGAPLLMGISTIGVASGITNLAFIFRAEPARTDYLKEHVKSAVGAGISVYTAFLAFGAARYMPAHAFNPLLWAFPVVVGITLILYHWRQIDHARQPRKRTAAGSA